MKKTIESTIILIERKEFEGLTGGYDKWDNTYIQSINLSNFKIKLNNNTLEDCLKAYCF